ncbi:SbmA/BacA-like family transporter [Crenalkalicoccus roseus]|uniref:SbmA/BacA-like family transporter n=1 Tax=Crenalkalicoccus roseus TaxID=1485588 RepID=UPI0010816481|nr:SbmA/BacA-like family transporter [Crenalkalicoccus roseus]
MAPVPAAPVPLPGTWRGTLRRFLGIAGGFWTSEHRRQAWGLTLGLLLLNATEVALLLRFNQWHRDLFDALERRDTPAVLLECAVLLLLVAAFAAVSCMHLQARRGLALGWRAWLAQELTGRWLAGGAPRAAPGEANADGRIHEDARIATEEAVELASSLSHGAMTLTCFVGVLWALSSHEMVTILGIPYAVPGYLLWIAVLYAGAGMVLAALLGRPLVRSTDHRQAMEAEYRAALVRARDGGRAEAESGPVLSGLFGKVAAAFHRQTRAYAHLQLFCVGNTRLGSGLPFLAATPAYLAGVVTLGWVMQAAQAFQYVAGALNWPVDHMPRIATWRASAERVIALHDAVLPHPAPVSAGPVPGTIPAAEAPAPAGGAGAPS